MQQFFDQVKDYSYPRPAIRVVAAIEPQSCARQPRAVS